MTSRPVIAPRHPGSVETGASWVIATIALVILAAAYGGPLLSAVAMKPIAADLDTSRSAAALAASLALIGAGVGGIFMGWLAERLGLRRVVMFGALMIAIGMAVSASGGLTALYIGHGVFMGLLGASCMMSPIMTYVTRWFDRRRGTAVALISSGQYIAGVIWPGTFQFTVTEFGWRQSMLFYAVVVALLVLPLAWIFLRPPPKVPAFSALHHGPPSGTPVAGLRPNIAFGLFGFAMFCCCMTMSMPMQHIVSLCSDLGIGPARGAAMLSVLLGSAFVARQFWGWLSDRIGGTRTILFGSIAQATAMTGFLLTQDEIGLFAVSAAFGMGYAGLIPAYILAIRDHYAASEASWRVPAVNFAGLLGMAGGGWTAGFLYDQFASYGIAFAVGLAFNILNLIVIVPLVARDRPARLRLAAG
jgi:MFS family permease